MNAHQPAASRIYHRLASPTQTPADAKLQQNSYELWGRARRGSDIPSVKTYPGPLPPGEQGVEFTSDVEPDPQTSPAFVRWTGPRPGVIVDGDYARITISVLRNTQSP